MSSTPVPPGEAPVQAPATASDEEYLSKDSFFNTYEAPPAPIEGATAAASLSCAVVSRDNNDILLNPDFSATMSFQKNGLMDCLTVNFTILTLEGNPPKKYRESSHFSLNFQACNDIKILEHEFDAESIKQLKDNIVVHEYATILLVELEIDLEYVTSNRFLVGAPRWMLPIVECVLTSEAFRAYVVADENTQGYLAQLKSTFDSQKTKGHPLMKLYPGARAIFQVGEGQGLSDKELQAIAGSMTDKACGSNWSSLLHYCSDISMALKFEQMELDKKRTRYEDMAHEARIIRLPGGGISDYLAFLPAPGQDHIRITSGDSVNVLFDLEKEDMETAWRGKADDLPGCPADIISVWLKRPFDKSIGETGDWKDNRVLHSVDILELPKTATFKSLREAPTTPVKIKIEQTNLEYRHAINTLKQICTNNVTLQEGNMFQINQAVLQGNRLDLLPEGDIFRHLADFYGVNVDFIDALPLNQGQKATAQAGRKARANILLAHGGPGTGKSHFCKTIITEYMKASESEKYESPLGVLFVAPKNTNVDDMAKKLNNIANELKAEGKCTKFIPVIRVHSHDTEKEIARRDAKLNHGRPANARPLNPALTANEEKLLEDFDLAQTIFSTYQRGQEKKHELVNDPRVRELEISLGYVMCQYAGIIDGGIKSADLSRWSNLRTAYSKWKHSREAFSDDDMGKFARQLTALRSETLSNAIVVCCTAVNAATEAIKDGTKNTTKLVIADESALIPEHVMLPIMMIPFTDLAGFVHVGDPYQTKPITMCSKKGPNMWRSRLELSTMTRLAQTGLPMYQFTIQHRMIPKISQPTNELTYHGLIVTDPGVLADTRNKSILDMVSRYNQEHFHTKETMILIDVPTAEGFSESKVTNTGSRYNEYYIMLGINLVASLLGLNASVKIAYISAYAAQVRLMLSAKAKCERKGVPGIDNFEVMSWIDAQGREFDIVVLDTLVTPNKSFGHADEQSQLTVATSRARVAQYAIMPKDLIDGHRYPNGRPHYNGLKEFMSSLMKNKRYYIREVTEYPACEYFKAGQVDPGFSQVQIQGAPFTQKKQILDQIADIYLEMFAKPVTYQDRLVLDNQNNIEGMQEDFDAFEIPPTCNASLYLHQLADEAIRDKIRRLLAEHAMERAESLGITMEDRFAGLLDLLLLRSLVPSQIVGRHNDSPFYITHPDLHNRNIIIEGNPLHEELVMSFRPRASITSDSHNIHKDESARPHPIPLQTAAIYPKFLETLPGAEFPDLPDDYITPNMDKEKKYFLQTFGHKEWNKTGMSTVTDLIENGSWERDFFTVALRRGDVRLKWMEWWKAQRARYEGKYSSIQDHYFVEDIANIRIGLQDFLADPRNRAVVNNSYGWTLVSRVVFELDCLQSSAAEMQWIPREET